jgi:cell division protein FtsI/penicillin-binding protein 2
VENALGQGQLTINPLTMAVMASAIVNDGNAVQPSTLLAIRRPDSDTWSAVNNTLPTIPVTTTDTARQLQDLMRYAVANGAAQNAGRPNIDIGGHATLAYSGESTQAWFVGFATMGGRRGIAAAVVLEGSDDAGLAADIGGTARPRRASGYARLTPLPLAWS